MKISEWLDKKEIEGLDVSQIVLPDSLSYDDVPNDTIFFKEINRDGILSTADHPFATVERFGLAGALTYWSARAVRTAYLEGPDL